MKEPKHIKKPKGIFSKETELVLVVYLASLPAICLISFNNYWAEYLQPHLLHNWFSSWYGFISGFDSEFIDNPEKYQVIYSWLLIFSLSCGIIAFFISPRKAYFDHFLPLPKTQLALFVASIFILYFLSHWHIDDASDKKPISYIGYFGFLIIGVHLVMLSIPLISFPICFAVYTIRTLIGKKDKIGKD